MAGKVVKMHRAFRHAAHAEVSRLRDRVGKLKSEKRSISLRYTNLHKRTKRLIEYLDDYIIPTLKTVRKRQCKEAVEYVRRLM